ncbi:MAG: hypothetical protein LBD18_00610 [Treponema sp.]|nr:hypothetical protein [Treponema sp.]
MMTNKVWLTVCALVFFSFHLDAQDSPRKGLVLSDSYASQERPGDFYGQKDSLMYYDFSLNFYEQHFMTEAIEEIERALIKYPYGIYYYIYGNYLTEIKDYANAEKAYKKAIVRFEYEFNYRYEVFRYFPSGTGADELFLAMTRMAPFGKSILPITILPAFIHYKGNLINALNI